MYDVAMHGSRLDACGFACFIQNIQNSKVGKVSFELYRRQQLTRLIASDPFCIQDYKLGSEMRMSFPRVPGDNQIKPAMRTSDCRNSAMT